MNRRNFIQALFLTPLIPAALKLEALQGPAVRMLVLGTERMELVTVPAGKATNFAALTPAQMKVWSRDLWDETRRTSFVERMTGPDAPIQTLARAEPTA